MIGFLTGPACFVLEVVGSISLQNFLNERKELDSKTGATIPELESAVDSLIKAGADSIQIIVDRKFYSLPLKKSIA